MQPNPLLHDVTGSGEPIVLLPGNLSGWSSWVPFVEPLAKNRKVVRVQLRSVELAEAGAPYPSDYGTHMEREALRHTVDQLGLTTFDLVGWSLGAHVSLAFAMEYPERVRTLTIIEPPSFWILRETGHVVDGLDQIEAADRALAGKQITVPDLKAFLFRTGLGQPDEFETMPGWPVWVRNRQSVSIVWTLWDYTESLDRLRRLTMPLLGVRGTETVDDLAAIVERLVALVPDGRLLELPGGHACHLQNMDHVLTALAEHTAAVRV